MRTFDISVFNEKKETIIELLNNINKISQEFEIKNICDSVENTINDLNNDRFNIVVVGEFSRGKSTFINALLGKRVLPSSVRPTTAILNKISYREDAKHTLIYRNSQEIKEVTEEEFRKITAPSEPIPGDEESEIEHRQATDELNKIAYADIKYPSELCKGGVEIVDTPGTNDLDPKREEITYTFIPKSDVAIMLLSANQILSDSEKHFIRDRILEADIQKVFFVINFKDRVEKEEERIKVINYAKDHLQDLVKNPKIFMVSAKRALNYKRANNGETVKKDVPESYEETGFEELERGLSEFLTEERGRVKLLKPIERGVRYCSEIKQNCIAIELNSLGLDLKELERRIELLKPELDKVRKVSSQTINSLKNVLENAGYSIRQEFSRGLENIADLAVRTVTNYTGELNGDDIARTIENTIAPMQTRLQETVDNRQYTVINDEVSRANRELGYQWNAMETSVVKALAVTTENNSLSITVENPDDYVGDAFIKAGAGGLGIAAVVGAIHLGIFAFPAALIGGKYLFDYFQEKNREKILGKVRVHVDRRYRDIVPSMIKAFDDQWRNRVNSVISNMEMELERNVTTIQDKLDNMLKEKSIEESKVNERKRFLMESAKRLDDIQEKLKKIGEI